jgi:hypothetical protein
MDQEHDRANGHADRRANVVRRIGAAVERVLAQRAVDVDATYARLEGRDPITLDEAMDDAATRRAEGRSRSTGSRRWRRACRFVQRFRLRFLVVAVLAAVS